MERATQLSVNLENRPGRLAELCDALAKAGINIRAISVIESTEQGLVRVVVDRTDNATKVLAECSFPFTETPVLLMDLTNEVGAMARIAKKLADSGVNISYVYGSAGDPGGKALLVLAISDMDRAERAFGQES